MVVVHRMYHGYSNTETLSMGNFKNALSRKGPLRSNYRAFSSNRAPQIKTPYQPCSPTCYFPLRRQGL